MSDFDRVEIGDCTLRCTLYRGDCLTVLPTLPEASVDAIICDPPYGLGFMGKDWDHGVPGVRFWQEALRVAKPGAHLLAFGGTRTFHRLACAIEDAGWEIRDCVMWVYGQGFPKSHDVSKAIDKAAGAEREVVGRQKAIGNARGKGAAGHYANSIPSLIGNGYEVVKDGWDITAPATDAAKQWEGWGTALKPSFEPVILARKPLIGTVAANVQQYGTGAINVDACRIPTEDGANLSGGRISTKADGWDRPWKHDDEAIARCRVRGQAAVAKAEQLGRWPANLIHDGSEEVVGLMPNNAARFFYCAKASRSERGEGNNHPTVKPTVLMRYLCRLVTPPSGTILDPFMGSGSTGKASVKEGFRFTGIELDPGYFDIAIKRIESEHSKLHGGLFQHA